MSKYNQYQSKLTKNWCAIVSLMQVYLYRYAVLVPFTWIINTAVFLDKIWVFSILNWATFYILDNALVSHINKQTELNFKLIKTTIPKLKRTDHNTYQIWITKYSSYRWDKAKVGWVITKKDIDMLVAHWWVGHAANWDWSSKWKFIDTDWKDNTDMSYEVLQYWYEKGLFFTNIRTVIPNDEETKQVSHLCIRMFQAEKKWKLKQYLKINENKKYIEKAKKLYFFWK